MLMLHPAQGPLLGQIQVDLLVVTASQAGPLTNQLTADPIANQINRMDSWSAMDPLAMDPGAPLGAGQVNEAESCITRAFCLIAALQTFLRCSFTYVNFAPRNVCALH